MSGKKLKKRIMVKGIYVFFLKNLDVVRFRSVLSKLGLNFLRNFAFPSLSACSVALCGVRGE